MRATRDVVTLSTPGFSAACKSRFQASATDAVIGETDQPGKCPGPVRPRQASKPLCHPRARRQQQGKRIGLPKTVRRGCS